MDYQKKVLTTSKVLEEIKKLLTENCKDYKIFEHEPVFTSEDAAKIREVSLSMGAKALIFYADTKPVLVVVPGDKKVDIKRFKQAMHVRDLRMATPEEVTELTGLAIGAIPPVGKAMALPSYYDSEIAKKDKVAFNAGAHTVSVIMRASDLVRIENPTIGDYAA